MKLGAALEHDLFDNVVVPLDQADLPGVERSALRKRSPHFGEARSHARPQLGEVLLGLQRRERLRAPLVEQAQVLLDVVPQHRAERRLRPARLPGGVGGEQQRGKPPPRQEKPAHA